MRDLPIEKEIRLEVVRREVGKLSRKELEEYFLSTLTTLVRMTYTINCITDEYNASIRSEEIL